MKALWDSARWCQWVEPIEGAKGENANVLFYRNRNGLGVAPAKLTAALQDKNLSAKRKFEVEMQDDSE